MFVVLGASAAGVSAIRELRRLNPTEKIMLISKDESGGGSGSGGGASLKEIYEIRDRSGQRQQHPQPLLFTPVPQP